MATYNTHSTYNRTYEKKVIEETPRVRVSSPFSGTTIIQPPNFPSFFPTVTVPSGLGSSTVSSSHSFGGKTGSLHSTDDTLQVTLYLPDFKPEELKVSVIGQQIVLEGKHGERNDELGVIERSFTRKFPLPRLCPPESVTSNLTGDGTLTISAVAPRNKESSPARAIPIKIVAGSTPAAASPPQQQQQQSSSTQQQSQQ